MHSSRCIVFRITQDLSPTMFKILVSAPRLGSNRGGRLQAPPPNDLGLTRSEKGRCTSCARMFLSRIRYIKCVFMYQVHNDAINSFKSYQIRKNLCFCIRREEVRVTFISPPLGS